LFDARITAPRLIAMTINRCVHGLPRSISIGYLEMDWLPDLGCWLC